MASSPEPPRRVEDLYGKTRDELVLMLIQLRRRQSQGRYVDPNIYHMIEQQISAEKSVINLVDNAVGPYGYNDSNTLRRQRNSERLATERQLVANQLESTDNDFEAKQTDFWRLDEAVNKQTEVVTSLQEQHQQLVDAINIIRQKLPTSSSYHQLSQFEASLQGIRASLATASRHLESLIFQRNELEKKLQEMRARQSVSRSVSVPSGLHQQPPVSRYYPQPVAPVAPMLQQRQSYHEPYLSNGNIGPTSPVYATVRRFQNSLKQQPQQQQQQQTQRPPMSPPSIEPKILPTQVEKQERFIPTSIFTYSASQSAVQESHGKPPTTQLPPPTVYQPKTSEVCFDVLISGVVFSICIFSLSIHDQRAL